MTFATQLDRLEQFHKRQTPCWPVDPYEFLIWWHCGYPASDTTCAKGWEALQKRIGITPEQLLQAKPTVLTAALRAGGLIPELRTQRVRLIATAVKREFSGDLSRALLKMQPDAIRRALKRLPGIADPGADRIMLFGDLSPIAAVPSNATQVAVRMQLGPTLGTYTKDYSAGQWLIETEVVQTFAARQRAFLLLKIHGQSICKRAAPNCDACPLAAHCAFRNSANAGKVKRPPRLLPSRR